MNDTELIEQQALAAALDLRAVPLRDGDWDDPDRYADVTQLAVSWEEPPLRPLYGGFVTPLGPPDGPSALVARGVVWCPGSSYAYMGFEAVRETPDEPWTIYPVGSE